MIKENYKKRLQQLAGLIRENEELPINLQDLVNAGKVTYRGLGMDTDIDGVKIRIDGKEYIISREKYDELGGLKKIKFHAPYRTDTPGEEIWP